MAETITIEGGSGLVVTLREFTVREENIAHSPSVKREGKVKTRLLEAVTVAVENPGPYEASAGRIDWETVLRGDREIVLRDARVFTWDADYYRDDACPRCHEPSDNCFDISKFPVQKLAASSVEHVKTGKPLECVLPRCGKKVKFRLFRGKDEKDLQRIATFREDEISTALHRLRVLEIEGVAPEKYEEFLTALGGKDSSFFRAAADKADCGIEQAGAWKCKCGYRWSADVDFTTDFFFPEHREKSEKI